VEASLADGIGGLRFTRSPARSTARSRSRASRS